MRITTKVPILLLLLTLLVACGGGEAVDTGGATETPSTEPGDVADTPATDTGGAAETAAPSGSYWSTSVQENGEPRALVDGTRIKLDFDGDSLGASAGCNSIGGTFTLSNAGALNVSDLFMTEMGCDGPRHEQDNFVADFLMSAPMLTSTGDSITLSNSAVTIELVDRSVADPDRSFIGTNWEVTGFFDQSVAMSLAVTEPGWVRFNDDSTAIGFDGCAEFTLNVEVSDGSTGGPIPEGTDGELQFGDTIATPSSDCADEGYAARVGASLRGQATYVIDGPNLTITGRDGTGITFQAVE